TRVIATPRCKGARRKWLWGERRSVFRNRTAPKHPLPKPERGCYHLVRFIRGDAVLDVFGEKFRMPSEVVYEYVIATIDVARQKLSIRMNEVIIDEHNYWLR